MSARQRIHYPTSFPLHKGMSHSVTESKKILSNIGFVVI